MATEVTTTDMICHLKYNAATLGITILIIMT